MEEKKKIKINKKRFIEWWEFGSWINGLDLKRIDFSELIEGDIAEKDIEEFGLIGLSNVYFLTSDFLIKKGYKRKFKY